METMPFRYGRPGSVYPDNFPTQIAASTTAGRPSDSGKAGDFDWQTDGWGIYGRSGDCGAITNATSFLNLSQMSVAVWARYHPATRIDPSYDYSTTAVQTLTVGWNNNVADPFIGSGCNTHGGSPALEDEPGGPDYPNHGWFNGVMDDVRIYHRALSASEVATLHSPETDSKPRPPSGLHVTTPE